MAMLAGAGPEEKGEGAGWAVGGAGILSGLGLAPDTVLR